MGKWQDDPVVEAAPSAARSASRWQDDPVAEPPDDAGVVTQALRGANKALSTVATAPFWMAHDVAERARARGETPAFGLPDTKFPDALIKGGYMEPPPIAPDNTSGRFAQSVGEAVGSTIMPTGALLTKAQQLAKLAPTTTLRALGQRVGEFFAGSPVKAVALDAAGATAAGVGQQGAREAELGPGYEVAAGALAPVAAIAGAQSVAAGARAARGMMMIPEDLFTPTIARWKANGDNIFRKLGLPMSADGSIPERTAGGDAAAYQMLANQLRRENVPVTQLDELLAKMAESRRFNSNSNAPDAVALVDMTPGMQKLAGSLMRSNPEAWSRGVDFFYSRQTGLTPFRGNAATPGETGIPSRNMFSPPITSEQAARQHGTDFGVPQGSIVPMGQRERVGDAFRRSLRIEDADLHGHASTAEMTDDMLEQMGKTLSKPLYDTAREAGRSVDLRPTAGPILDRWEAALENETGPVRRALATQVKEFRRAIGAFQPSNTPDVGGRAAFGGNRLSFGADTDPRYVSPFERFDKAKQMLDEQIRQAYKNPSKQNTIVANALQQFKRELLDGAKNEAGHIIMPGIDGIETNALGAKYKAARGVFQSVAESRRALETGGDIWAGKAGVGEYSALSDDVASQKLVRLGIHGGYEKDTANMPVGHDATKLFDKPRLHEVLREIIPRSQDADAVFANRPERFGDYLGFEKMGMHAAGKTVGNSSTAERIADDKAASALHDVVEQFRSSKSFWQFGAQAAAAKLNWLFGYRADTSATMARALFNADPVVRAEVIDGIRRHMGQSRFTYFTQLMDQQARAAPASRAAATATMGSSMAHGQSGSPGNPVPVRTPEEADKLPSGTHFTTPDGRNKVRP